MSNEATPAEGIIPASPTAEGMTKQFNHMEAEGRLYRFWEELGIFHANVDPKKKPFCVVMPPPNVTGILHMGHVLDNVPQDVMTRWHRMRGFSAVWIPGTDHAGIATQNVVKRQLEKDGIRMCDLGREEFVKRIWQWKEKHGDIIINQLKRLGCSCDWERERFTMDEGLARAVLAAFVQLFEKGLVYRGKRMINWCTVCGTALADDEVEHAQQTGSIWHLRYPLLDAAGKETGEHVIVATTRPETMLGDTAVAVHPDDKRYTALVGRNVLLPLQNRAIPVIADPFVDPAFGTGVVKLTPAHDPNDYQVGLKLNLPFITVIGADGKMTGDAGTVYVGLDRYEARKRVVADLDSCGALEKIEKHKNAVGECYRCKTVLEPMISDQWFVKMRPLAEKAKAAVTSGRLQIIPDSEKHDYFHWMDTIQDWCISRQLWWGHRIPVYYCDGCSHIMAKVEAPMSCEKCGGTALHQDEDVLDTWFSSQLWPFSTLGWPDKTPELDYWYPTTWLMSGRDILFFWDARMIIAGLELLGDVPFNTLVLHGLVRDSQGRKLSKSLGNSPDPLELFEKYGTDAVRAAIAMNYPLGRQDTKLSEEIFRNGQGLVIKLWNATKLLLGNLPDDAHVGGGSPLKLETLEDRWIFSRLRETVRQHDAQLARSSVVHAFKAVNDFFWNDYCDWYLEIIKPRLYGDKETKERALAVALACEEVVLKLFHPYIPFITEELWQILAKRGLVQKSDVATNALAASAWPEIEQMPTFPEAEERIDLVISMVRGVRDVRHHLNIPPRGLLSVQVLFLTSDAAAHFEEVRGVTQSIGFLSDVRIVEGQGHPAGHVPFKFSGGIGYVLLPGDVDNQDLRTKLSAKIEKLEKALSGVEANLNNSNFISNAPEALVTETKGKAAELRESIAKLDDFRSSL